MLTSRDPQKASKAPRLLKGPLEGLNGNSRDVKRPSKGLKGPSVDGKGLAPESIRALSKTDLRNLAAPGYLRDSYSYLSDPRLLRGPGY